MGTSLFGLETEYGVSGSGGDDVTLLPDRLMALAQRRLVHLTTGRGFGMFLGNGARFYLDAGCHPEYCTPECIDPWQLVRHVKAGDRAMVRLARELAETAPGTTVRFFRGNVDYSGSQTSWGCHESYLVPRPASLEGPSGVIEQVMAHLVTRVIFAGGGGFNPRCEGIEFTLSPRAWHLDHAVSDSSTGGRGIFHTKDESLSNGRYRRVHLICGDGLRSETSLWLTVGTTALVLAVIGAGKRPGSRVRLARPLEALRAIVRDPGCTVRIALATGGEASAIEVQRHYLQEVERYLGAAFLPDWAEAVCRRWREVLDGLESDPASLAPVLDWPLKHALYRDRLARRGLDWEQAGAWNAVVAQVQAAAADEALHRQREAQPPLSPKLLRFRQFRRLAPTLDGRRAAWRELNDFLALRQELCTARVGLETGRLPVRCGSCCGAARPPEYGSHGDTPSLNGLG